MRGIKIATAFGIPIRFHWTFLIILPVFAAIIGWDIVLLAELLNTAFGAEIEPTALEGTWRPWILGFVAAVGLFAGVLLHEIGHSLVALRYEYEIESITLWLLGGLANFTAMPEDWRHEFWIAIAGPIVSIGVGAVCYLGFLLTPPEIDSVRFVLSYLAVLNVFLAGFNMLPAFPMDGGRVLRAILARRRPHAEATQLAADVGKFFAVLLGLFGLLTFNVVLLLLAFFIYIAAAGEAQQTTIRAAFEGVTVGEVMTHREALQVVAPETTVNELMERMLQERHTGYPVVDHGEVVGVVTLTDAREIKTTERDAFRIEDIMTRPVLTVSPSADAMDAFERIQQNEIGRLPVVTADGDLVGIISRTDLMKAFNIMQAGGISYLKDELFDDSGDADESGDTGDPIKYDPR